MLRHIADKLGLPVFTIAVDFSKYFHQCFFTARELWKCGALMPRAAEGGGASDQLDAWTELVMSMGLVPSSEIAQRLSNALMQAFSRELAKAEAYSGWLYPACTGFDPRRLETIASEHLCVNFADSEIAVRLPALESNPKELK